MHSLEQALKDHFGFAAFRPYQRDIVAAALEGKDVLGVLPTGAGKSLTFQLPALLAPGVSLVVSPLIALMEDQVHQLAVRGIHSAACYTGRTSAGEWDAMYERAADGELKLLYVAPERLASPRFQEAAAQLNISFMVVDEAHCVSEWGHNFRPEYRQILNFTRQVPEAPVIALTATATPDVRRDIAANLDLRGHTEVIGDFDRANLIWQVVEANGKKQKLAALVERLSAKGPKPAIVYATTRNLTEEIAIHLNANGVRAAHYHAGLSGGERERRQAEFRDGKMPVLAATIAFGMGVHKDDVRQVIHYGLPRSLEAYYQEAGRAGRDGEEAACVLLYSRSDLRYLHQWIEDSYPGRDVLRRIQLAAVKNELRALATEMDGGQDSFALGLSALLETGYLSGNGADGYAAGEGGDNGARALRWLERHRRSELNRLYAVRDYGEAPACRASILLSYFGQTVEACGHCDLCLDIRPPAARAAKRAGAPKAERARTASAAPVHAMDQELFEHLRAWRVALAREWQVPAFHIMSDKTLREAALCRPTDRDTFLLVNGLGEKKWEAFGEQLTSFMKEYAKAHV